MATEDDFLPYEDDVAVQFIQNTLPQELKEKFKEDDIYYLLDVIAEYYDSKGVFDDDPELEVDIDEDEMLDFIIKNAKKDEIGQFTPEEIRFVIQGEIGYCDSIGMFEE